MPKPVDPTNPFDVMGDLLADSTWGFAPEVTRGVCLYCGRAYPGDGVRPCIPCQLACGQVAAAEDEGQA